jgi:FKBP-type peptidyl-prolyl cis-trans isomerase
MFRSQYLLLGATATLLAACLDSPTGGACSTWPVEVESVSGDTVRITSGLRYIDGETGVGGRLDWCEEAVLHYTGSLTNGDVFDSSRDSEHGPMRFVPGRGGTITGFQQGVIGMRREGTRRLIIPPQLGYGSQTVTNEDGEVIIPANSTLIFDIELIERVVR